MSHSGYFDTVRVTGLMRPYLCPFHTACSFCAKDILEGEACIETKDKLGMEHFCSIEHFHVVAPRIERTA